MGMLVGSGVQTFAVSNGGQSVYWLNTNGNLSGSVNGGWGTTQLLDSGVESLAPAASGMELVVLFADGGLTVGVPHYYMGMLAGSGVQTFAVSNGGQSVYWLDTGGNLSGSVNGGWGTAQLLDGGVESFAAASGMELVVLFADGGLAVGVPHYYMGMLAGSGVQTFSVSNGGRSVYWLDTGGNLSGSVNGGWGTTQLLDGGVESFRRPPAVWSSSYSSPTAAWPRACPTTTWACWPAAGSLPSQ